MRGKQEWGVGGFGVNSPNPPEAWRGSHTAQTPFTPSAVKQQLSVRLCSGETDSNYSVSFLSLSLWVRREPLNGKPRERSANLPSSSSSVLLFQRETHLPPALGEGMLVYFEWCAIMTVQQINVTQVCGKRLNFRVIPCKLLILSGEVAT